MAKKATKKAVKKTRFDKKKSKPKASAPRRPKAQALPGMEIAKDRLMDQFCESMADVREVKSDATKSEKDINKNALARMLATGRKLYRAHGIEFMHVHGDDKVRVRAIDSDEGGEDQDDDVEGLGDVEVDPGTGTQIE